MTLWWHSDDTLMKLWWHSDDTLKTLWRHSEHIKNTLWTHSEHTLNTLWTHSEHTLEICPRFDKISITWINHSPTWIQAMLAHLKTFFSWRFGLTNVSQKYILKWSYWPEIFAQDLKKFYALTFCPKNLHFSKVEHFIIVHLDNDISAGLGLTWNIDHDLYSSTVDINLRWLYAAHYRQVHQTCQRESRRRTSGCH